MSIVTTTPGVAGLHEAVAALRGWQRDRAPLQLHPGDLGFHWRDGAQATADALRVWSRDGRVVALGLIDGPQLLRLAVDPELQLDEDLVGRLVDDITAPERGVLDPGSAVVEARCGPLLADALQHRGWQLDEPWTPCHRDLSDPVEDRGLRIETIGADRAEAWVAVHWSAFRGSPMTGDDDRRRAVDRWHSMAGSAPFADARCLAAFDEHDNAVAVVGVWSAGPGRPGLLEPMGVHHEHRGLGHGRAITVAAAAALREMGSSSAIVCAESSNAGAVATYASAGFTPYAEVCDLRRSE
ncbi:GNAT family N-acetyltransferase [Humibacillus xanthopallidus]|uniref:GNAT family N-acetyltransferase n=1 Tax=Humibacillus xanthopallidus TaxID=412689 RepID=UPI00384AFA80